MNLQDFIKKYNSKGIDYDGYYGFQCMDLAHQYAVEVLGQDIPAAPGAKDVWTKVTPGYVKIANAPDNAPLPGDIVIWGTGIGPFGHIAVAVDATSFSFTSFDQNFPLGTLCHLQKHNYNGVLGWLRPLGKPAPIAQPIAQATFTDQTVIDLGPYGKMEVQALRGKLGDLEQATKTTSDLKIQVLLLQTRVQELTNLLAESAKTTAISLSTLSTSQLVTELFRRLAGR